MGKNNNRLASFVILFIISFCGYLSAGLTDEEKIILGYLKSTDNSSSVFIGKNLKKWMGSTNPIIRENALNYAVRNNKIEENQDEVVLIAINGGFPGAAERAVYALARMKDNAAAIEKTRGLYEEITGAINAFITAYDKLDAAEISKYIQKRGPFIVRLSEGDDYRTLIYDRAGAADYFVNESYEQKKNREIELKKAGKDAPKMKRDERKKYLEGLDNFGFAPGRKIVLDDDLVISDSAGRYFIYKKHEYPSFPQYNRYLGNIRFNIRVIPVGFRLSDKGELARVRHYVLLGMIKDKWMILGIEGQGF